MANSEMKQKIKDSGLYQWQIAAELGVSEMTLIRWLRVPLSETHAEQINTAIEKLKGAVTNE